MIIDAHSHWLPVKIVEQAHFFSPAWNNIEAQWGMMEEVGIDKTILTYPTSDAHLKWGNAKELAQYYNNAVAQIMERYPDRFIGAAILPWGETEEMIQEFKRATEVLGFKVLSLPSSYDGVYLDDPRFFPIYEIAQKQRILIFVHPQIVNPIGCERVRDSLLTPVVEYVFDTTISIGKILMGEIFKRFPEIVFVFASFGGVIAHLASRFDETYKMLRGINLVKDLGGNPTQFLRNIYVDTGGDKTSTNFLAAVELFGASHILWGSDWPAKKDPRSSIKTVESLNLNQKEIKGILGENLNNLLKGV